MKILCGDDIVQRRCWPTSYFSALRGDEWVEITCNKFSFPSSEYWNHVWYLWIGCQVTAQKWDRILAKIQSSDREVGESHKSQIQKRIEGKGATGARYRNLIRPVFAHENQTVFTVNRSKDQTSKLTFLGRIDTYEMARFPWVNLHRIFAMRIRYFIWNNMAKSRNAVDIEHKDFHIVTFKHVLFRGCMIERLQR